MDRLIRYHKLTPAEERVLLHAGTEPPGSGEYSKKSIEGVYLCRRCDHALYMTSDQFESHCGWPSFDEALPGAITERQDRDGQRIEIVCGACGAHLGHLFHGEYFTPKDARYCVNSLALRRVDAYTEDGFARAFFAAGCFWGVEHDFQKFPGVVRTHVGYMGGISANPTYEEVCQGTTGHAETVEVVYDRKKTSYEALVSYFFTIHDPTTYHRQGPDVGSQYRSVCFYLTPTQRDLAMNAVVTLRAQGRPIVTEVVPAQSFYLAESYHQGYCEKHGR